MLDISGVGAKITIISTLSFPFGFSITEFSHDTDPIAVESTELVGFEMLIDGSLYSFQKANPLKMTISVIPGGQDDINMKQLLLSKNGGISLLPLPDQTILTVSYADGGMTVFTNGSILSGPLGDSVQVSGTLKTNSYVFAFGSVTRLNSLKDVLTQAAGLIGGLL